MSINGNQTVTAGSGDDIITVGGGLNSIDVGSGDDRVTVTGANGASNTVFTSITGFGAGDKLTISPQAGALTATAALGAAVTPGGSPTLQDYLDAAAAGNGSGTSIMTWFKMGSDTYVVLDSSSGGTFNAGTDIVVKLVGVSTIDLTGHTMTSGVLTL